MCCLIHIDRADQHQVVWISNFPRDAVEVLIFGVKLYDVAGFHCRQKRCHVLLRMREVHLIEDNDVRACQINSRGHQELKERSSDVRVAL